jgi:hypothetical protein
MDKSVFTDKNSIPNDHDLKNELGDTYSLWTELVEYLINSNPKVVAIWNYPGEKYGWSYVIKNKRRAIIYLLPRQGYFKIAFVFGQKATDIILDSKISEGIKSELMSSKVYAEGRGIRIDIKDSHVILDIKLLIDIKSNN